MTGPRPIGVTKGAIISAVSHEGLSVTVDGKPAQLAIITEDGHIFAAGEKVAREVEAVAINKYRDYLLATGRLRVLSKPIEREPDGGRMADET